MKVIAQSPIIKPSPATARGCVVIREDEHQYVVHNAEADEEGRLIAFCWGHYIRKDEPRDLDCYEPPVDGDPSARDVGNVDGQAPDRQAALGPADRQSHADRHGCRALRGPRSNPGSGHGGLGRLR